MTPHVADTAFVTLDTVSILSSQAISYSATRTIELLWRDSWHRCMQAITHQINCRFGLITGHMTEFFGASKCFGIMGKCRVDLFAECFSTGLEFGIMLLTGS